MGCNPSTAGPIDGPGDYAAMISGDIVADLTGQATFSTTLDRHRTRRWAIMMASGRINEETSDLIVLMRRGSRVLPAAGTYPIRSEVDSVAASTDFVATFAHNRRPSRSSLFLSLDGSLTIVTSSDTLVTGRFTFDARFATSTGEPFGRDVAVSGTFRAKPSLFLIVAAPESTGAPSA